VRLVLH